MYINKTNTFIIFLNVLIFHPKTHFLVVKMNSLAILESKTFIITPCTLPIPTKKILHYGITKKTISTPKWKSPTGKVMLWAIPSYITTKTHCVPCNM
jgi:hypothetical protein